MLAGWNEWGFQRASANDKPTPIVLPVDRFAPVTFSLFMTLLVRLFTSINDNFFFVELFFNG